MSIDHFQLIIFEWRNLKTFLCLNYLSPHCSGLEYLHVINELYLLINRCLQYHKIWLKIWKRLLTKFYKHSLQRDTMYALLSLLEYIG